MFFQFWGSFPRVVFEIDIFFMWIFYVINFLIMQLTILFYLILFYFFPLNLTQKLLKKSQFINLLIFPFTWSCVTSSESCVGWWKLQIAYWEDRNDVQVNLIRIFSSNKFSHRCQKLAKSFEKFQTIRKIKTKLTFLDNFLRNPVPDIF